MRYNSGFIGVDKTPTATNQQGIHTASNQFLLRKLGYWSDPPAGVSSATDPYFNYTTLLLSGDGSNASQNNTFLDSSSNNFTITRNGDTTQGTFSPFSHPSGYWSNYFNAANSDVISLGTVFLNSISSSTATFTMEAWVYLNSFGTNATSFYNRTILAKGQIYLNFGIDQNGKVMLYHYDGTGRTNASTNAISLNTWTHVAAVVNGSGTITFYINGVANGTATWYGHSGTNQTARLGGTQDTNGGVNNYWNGYITNVRTTSTQVYTSSFTPSTTPLTAITGTTFLSSQSNYFVDNSSNAYTLTVAAGSPSVQLFNPFNLSTIEYSSSTVGGSGYFDGTGDYLSTPSITVGANNFTFECWVYSIPSQSGNPRIFEIGGDNNDYLLLQYAVSTTTLSLIIGTGGGGTTVCSTTISFASAWTHIAVVREGTGSNQVKMYINGVNVSTGTSSTTIPGTFAYIGGISWASPFHWKGYISSARLVVGSAVYTGNFTLPAEPLTAITNTQLLLNFTNAAIIDSTATQILETEGNAQLSTTQKKFGSSSLYFDGTGDFVRQYAPIQPLAVGKGNFTVECWVYFNTSGQHGIFQTSTTAGGFAASSANSIAFQRSGTSQWEIYANNTNSQVNVAINENTWYHVALTRAGDQTKFFVNGINLTTVTDSVDYTGAYIGLGAIYSTAVPLNGYIDDFRFTSGYARYTYNFTPPTVAHPLKYGAETVSTTDPYFNYTTLLLSGDGTNGGQNNTFLDSSSNNFTITRNGNTTQGTFSPFSHPSGYWSNYFDGSGDYLTTTASGSWVFPADYTIEGWIFSSSLSWSLWATGGSGSSDQFVCNNGDLYWDYTVTGSIVGFFTTSDLNKWVHVAVCRSGSTVKAFKNGTQISSWTSASSIGSNATAYIGRRTDGFYQTSGYMSNLRVVKGNAIYTSAFTPPTTPLTVVSGTQLLTCQANRFIDESAQFNMTVNGNTSVQAFSPFAPTAAYSASTVGGSGYFDGTGDNLSIANNAAFQFGSGDFTVEAWVYAPSNPPGIGSIVSHSDGASASGTQFLVRTEGGNTSVVAAVYSGGTGYVATWSSALPIGQWNHVAFTRSGTSTYLWVNGVQRATASVGSVSLNTTSTALTIGSNASASADNWLGYISGTRITKGAALYTATFTPPTAPPTTTVSSGTVGVLLNFTNAGIFDNAQMNDLETVGNAQISTSVVKYGTGSMYFDGTGDYLVGRTTDLLSFNTGDFTVEMWIYPNSVAGNIVLIDTRSSGTDSGWAFYINSSSKLALFTSNADRITAGPALSASTWTHVVLARSGSTLAIYMNGVQSATATYSTTMTCPGRISIASGFDNAAPLNGYIDDLRITKGIARYVQNFTPPSAALQLL